MSATHNSVLVLSQEEIDRSLIRISHEIVEKNHGVENLVLMGIPTRGRFLAERIAGIIAGFEKPVPCGTLDITMFRDDLRLRAPRAISPTIVPDGGISGKDVILVDDVLFSGRTIRSALDALNEIGRPRSVQLAVLVDRGHRELPIRADFVGKNLPTSLDEKVQVHLNEIDEDSSVYVVKGGKV
jgi:pyrimidine operon attenuation protein/uracil phosphoribosyltransferase